MVYWVCIRPLVVAMAIAYGLWLLDVAFLLWLLPMAINYWLLLLAMAIACGYGYWLQPMDIYTMGYYGKSYWPWLLVISYWLLLVVISYGYWLWLLATNYGYLHNGLLCLQLLAMDKGIAYCLSLMPICYWLLILAIGYFRVMIFRL